MSDRRVSVVVLTRNRVEELCRTLGRLAELPESPRTIVVDNGSTDGTVGEVWRRFPDVLAVGLVGNVGAAGRNIGVSLSDSAYVAFCDDDTWWEPGSLSAAADLLDHHPRLAVVTGTIIVEPAAVEDPICEELRNSPLPAPADVPGHPLLSFLAGASVLRRAAFTGAGGFDPRLLIGGEEELLGADLAAAGWALSHIPEVVLHHQASLQRDPHRRRRLGIRNTLWFTWMRRQPSRAADRTRSLLRTLPRDGVTAAALGDAVGGVPSVLRRRRTLPPAVERDLRRLERSQLESRARRYVS